MALKNFTQFTPYTTLSSTDFMVGYRSLDEIRTDLDSMSLGVSALLISKGFLPGTIVGRVQRVSYRYTIASGSPVNAVSGADDNGLTLSYTPGQVEVYRNGSHLVNSLDFLATTSTQITNLSTLNLGDIVEVVALSGIGATIQYQLSGFIGSLVQRNYRYSVATGNTIVPGSTIISGADDYGSVLAFNTNSFQVYLNGSHLVRDYDYSAFSSGTSLTLAMPVAAGDSVDVVSLSACFTSGLSSISAFSGISRLNPGNRVTLSNSTGNVTVSSQTCNSDFPAADWTNASHIARWGTLQAYLSGVAQANSSISIQSAFIEYYGSGSFPGGGAYCGAVLAPNGKIHLVPMLATLGRIVDPINNSVTTYGNIPTTNASKYHGGVLAPNGKIYFAPHDSTFGLVVDPSNNSVVSYGTFRNLGSAGYVGGVVSPQGKIYFAPYNATNIAKVDPETNTVSMLQFLTTGGYHSGVLSPNGKIYFIPNILSSAFLVLDPSNDSMVTFGTIGGSYRFHDGVVAPNGKIYTCPHLATYAVIVDPSDNSTTTYGPFPGSNSHQGIVLVPNGKLYCIPSYGSIFSVVDPENNTVSSIGTLAANFVAAPFNGGAILAPNGKLFLVPSYSTTGALLNITLNTEWNMNVYTNPFFNKTP